MTPAEIEALARDCVESYDRSLRCARCHHYFFYHWKDTPKRKGACKHEPIDGEGFSFGPRCSCPGLKPTPEMLEREGWERERA